MDKRDGILDLKTIYVHGSLGLPLAIIGYPLAIWLPAHYAGSVGISLATVGLMLTLARLSDVITDPLMGEISDRWKTYFGRRKPWIMIGTPVMMIGIYRLFVPSEDAGAIYFLIWLTIFFMGNTMLALPHRAWGAELSTDYHQRSRVTAAREFYILTGLMIAATVPMIVEIVADGGDSVTIVIRAFWQDAVGVFSSTSSDQVVVNRETLTGPVLAALAVVILVLLPISSTMVVTRVAEINTTTAVRVTFIQGLKYVKRNGPMMRLLIIMALAYIGEGLSKTVSLFFIRDIIVLPTIGAAYFFYFLAGLACIPFWLWLGRRIGKHKAYMATLITIAVVSFANLFLGTGDYLPFLILFLIKGACFGALQFLPLAMIADVVDVETARSGVVRSGTYFACLGLTEKIAVAFSAGAALGIIGYFGFSPSGGIAESTASGIEALRLVYCLSTVIFYGLGFIFLWSYPLTPERHAKLRMMLDRRRARLASA